MLIGIIKLSAYAGWDWKLWFILRERCDFLSGAGKNSDLENLTKPRKSNRRFNSVPTNTWHHRAIFWISYSSILVKYPLLAADIESNKRNQEDSSICDLISHRASYTKPPWSGEKQHFSKSGNLCFAWFIQLTMSIWSKTGQACGAFGAGRCRCHSNRRRKML